MLDRILKMGGCSSVDEFYAKYPSEESFIEAFPQARPLLEQYKNGGDIEAFPQARPMMQQFAKGGNSVKRSNKSQKASEAEMQYVMAYLTGVMQYDAKIDEDKIKEFVAQYSMLGRKEKQKTFDAIKTAVDQYILQQQEQQKQALAQQAQANKQASQQSIPEQAVDMMMAQQPAQGQPMQEQAMMEFGGQTNPFSDNGLQKFLRGRNSGGMVKAQGGKELLLNATPAAATVAPGYTGNASDGESRWGIWPPGYDFESLSTPGDVAVNLGLAYGLGEGAVAAGKKIGGFKYPIDPDMVARAKNEVKELSRIATLQGVSLSDLMKQTEIALPDNPGHTMRTSKLALYQLMQATPGVDPSNLSTMFNVVDGTTPTSTWSRRTMDWVNQETMQNQEWIGRRQAQYEKQLMDSYLKGLGKDPVPDTVEKAKTAARDRSFIGALMDFEEGRTMSKTNSGRNFIYAASNPKTIDMATDALVDEWKNKSGLKKAYSVATKGGLSSGKFGNIINWVKQNPKRSIFGLIIGGLTAYELYDQFGGDDKETTVEKESSTQAMTPEAEASSSSSAVIGSDKKAFPLHWKDAMSVQDFLSVYGTTPNAEFLDMPAGYDVTNYPNIGVIGTDTIPVSRRKGGASPFNYGYPVGIMETGGTPDSYNERKPDDVVQAKMKKFLNYTNAMSSLGLLMGEDDNPPQYMQESAKFGKELGKKKSLVRYQSNIYSPNIGQTGTVDFSKPYEEMTEDERFIFDAQQVQAEQEAKRALDPNYTGGLTDYEINREAERQRQMSLFKPGISEAEPGPGEMGPPKPDYVLDKELADEQLANMPGSTARVHYTPEGEYIPGMTQRKKQRASNRMAAASCPEGYEYDPRQQKCVPEGTRSRSKVGKFFKKMGDKWKGMSGEGKANTILNIGDYIVGNREQMMSDIENAEAEDFAINMMNMTGTAPTYMGSYLTNNLDMKTQRERTPTQFTSYNPGNYAQRGMEVPGMDLYLSDEEIDFIRKKGGNITYLD